MESKQRTSEGGGGQLMRLHQRVAELESELADALRQRNEEVGALSSEVARVSSQLEAVRLERQRVEVQLTMAQSKGRACKQAALEKEGKWNATHEGLKGRISQLSSQCQQWRSTLDSVQQARAEERREHQHTHSAKDEEVGGLRSKCTDLEHVQEQLKADLAREKEMSAKLQARVRYAEGLLREKVEQTELQAGRLKSTAVSEMKLQKDLQASLQKCRLLEEGLENSGRSLAESRHARQACQTRLREAEAGLDTEKKAHRETTESLEAARLSLERLQTTLNDELRKHTLASEEMYSQVLECQALEREVAQRQTVMSDFSHQLAQCKTTSDTLQTQLDKARDRLSSMEKTHAGHIKETESILKQFAEKIKLPDGITALPPNPAHFPAWLQTVLKSCEVHFASAKCTLHETKIQLATSKQKLNKIATECLSYREIVTNRTSAMEEAEQRVCESAREVARLRSEVKRGVAQMADLQLQLAGAREKGAEEVSRHQETRDELLVLKKRQLKEEEVRCHYLQTLCEQLQTAGLPAGNPAPNGRDHAPSSPSGWGNLTDSTSAAAAAVLETLRQSKGEVEELCCVLKDHQATLELAEQQHREDVRKLADSLQEREEVWNQRNQALNQHFQTLRSDTQTATQELERSVEASLREIEQLAASKRELVAKLDLVQETHRSHRLDRACLLSSTCLLAGALFPALERSRRLQAEKSLLLGRVSELEGLKSQVVEIVASILTDIEQSEEPQSTTSLVSLSRPRFFHPLLAFRKAAIAILAAKRILKLHKESMLIFRTSRGSGTSSVAVNITYREKQHLKRRDERSLKRSKFSSKDLAAWLRSERTLSEVRESFSDLQNTLDRCSVIPHKGKRSDHHYETSALASTRQALSAYLCRVSAHHCTPPSDQTSTTAAAVSPDSLWQRLGQGLAAIIRSGQAPLSPYVSSTELGELLHTQLVSLVGRLHDGEVARQTLASRLLQTSAECGRLSGACRDTERLEAQVKTLQDQLCGMVPHKQFTAVCSDLEGSLQREREAGVAVATLSAELQLLGARLAEGAGQREGLAREAGELRTALLEAEHASGCVTELLKCVHSAFTQSRQKLAQINQAASSQPPDHHQQQHAATPDPTSTLIQQAIEEFTRQRPAASTSPASSAALEVLRSFLDAHQSALDCLSTLYSQLLICEEHTLSLKTELGAACRRQMAVAALPAISPQSSFTSREAGGSKASTHSVEGFAPLQESSSPVCSLSTKT